MWCILGCSTMKRSSSSNVSDSVAVNTFNYDSAWRATVESMKQTLTETERHYGDTPRITYIEGKAVYLPERTIERHFITEKNSNTNAGQVTRVDSSNVEVAKAQAKSSKETKGIPFWGWVAIGGSACFLIFMILVFVLIARQASKLTQVINSIKRTP